MIVSKKQLKFSKITFFLINLKHIKAGFVVGEDGLGQYTKGSDFMKTGQRNFGKHPESNLDSSTISVNGEEGSLPDLPSLSLADFEITNAPEPTESSLKPIVDPNHQQLIKPDFQLVKEWDCSIENGECRKQMDQFIKEMNKRRNPAFEDCQADYFLTKYGKALRFSLKGTVNTFNAWVENDCGECLRCNFIGWFDDLGFLRNFDYDCVKNEELIQERQIAQEKINNLEAERLRVKTENLENLKKLRFEANESGVKRLGDRRRAL